MSTRHAWRAAFLALATSILVGCSAQQQHARAAIADIEAAVAAAGPNAPLDAPVQVADINARLARLRSSLAEKDYARVMADAPAVLATARALPALMASNRAAQAARTRNEWVGLASTLPHEIASINERIASLERHSRLPRGLNHSVLASAATSLKDVRSEWATAASEYAGGRTLAAVSKAKDVQHETTQLMTELGMSSTGGGHS
jgi:hypothetical protein